MKFFGGKKDKAAVFLPASEGDFKIVRREGTGPFGGQRQGAQGGRGVRSAQNAAAPLCGPIPFAVCGGAAPRAAGASGQEAAKQALWARYAGTVAFLLAQAQKVAPQAVQERTAAAAPKNAEKADRRRAVLSRRAACAPSAAIPLHAAMDRGRMRSPFAEGAPARMLPPRNTRWRRALRASPVWRG